MMHDYHSARTVDDTRRHYRWITDSADGVVKHFRRQSVFNYLRSLLDQREPPLSCASFVKQIVYR